MPSHRGARRRETFLMAQTRVALSVVGGMADMIGNQWRKSNGSKARHFSSASSLIPIPIPSAAAAATDLEGSFPILTTSCSEVFCTRPLLDKVANTPAHHFLHQL